MTRSPFVHERASKKSIARARMVAIVAGLACVLGLSGATLWAGGPPDCIPGTLVTYAATGAIEQYDVPANATELRVELTGGSACRAFTCTAVGVSDPQGDAVVRRSRFRRRRGRRELPLHARG